MANEAPGQTLQPTALVHEAYLRLVGSTAEHWNSRGHFFAAAAEAMRRILVENARRKQRLKHGGGLQRVDLTTSLDIAMISADRDLIAVDEALNKLAQHHPRAAKLIELRFFAASRPLRQRGSSTSQKARPHVIGGSVQALLRADEAGEQFLSE